jgi:hypothetical protein
MTHSLSTNVFSATPSTAGEKSVDNREATQDKSQRHSTSTHSRIVTVVIILTKSCWTGNEANDEEVYSLEAHAKYTGYLQQKSNQKRLSQ